MNHYVYLLESRIEQKYYIGCRSCKVAIGKDKYMGSSRVMTKRDKDNCNKIILKRFDSRKEAIAYEIEMHNQFDVATNPMFWNKSKQTSTGFDTAGITFSNTVEHNEKIRQSKLGVPRSAETKRKMREANLGKKLSSETKEKIGASSRLPVRCIETGIEYSSVKEATKAVGLVSSTSISKVCKGDFITAAGYTWEYVNKDLELCQ